MTDSVIPAYDAEPPDEPLTAQQQRLMRYVDDELDADERAAFERELAANAELAAETADYVNFMHVSRSLPLIEPADHELRRFWTGFYNRTEWQLGWLLLVVGIGVLGLYGAFWFVTFDAIPAFVRIAGVCAALGGGMLLWNTVRQKLRMRRFDRYKGVTR